MMDQLMIVDGDPRHPEAFRLLQESHKLLSELFPQDDIYALSVEELCKDNVKFYVAINNGKIIGCAALSINEAYAELKSMFVAEKHRGQGVAQKLLDRILTQAKIEQLPFVKLETGFELNAAVDLYKKNGFTFCDRFGAYSLNETSVYMEKSI